MKHSGLFMMVVAALVAGLALASCQKEDNNSSTASNGGNNGGGGSTPAGWVDLGLPSGLLWAECNLGASSPEEYGNYYAWGETTTKGGYDWSTYAYGNASNALTKYCDNAAYGLNGFTDNLTTLQAMDDAATAALGNGARMPTKEEWQELINNTTVEWTTMNGVNGCKFTGSNGNTLFLPATGHRHGSELSAGDLFGFYWSSSLYESRPDYAWHFGFVSDGQYVDIGDRYVGFTVRAVRQNTTVEWVNLGLPSGLLWAKCNLGANAPEEYGNYYAWGETATKEVYNWSTYRYCTVDGEGNLQTLTKYNTHSTYGTTDHLTTLQAMDDAATQALGNGARTPTKEEWQELIANTTMEWTTMNGVNGRKFTAANGNTLFLPATGSRVSSELRYAGSGGHYWSSSLNTISPDYAWDFYFVSDGWYVSGGNRYFGSSVRAVRQN